MNNFSNNVCITLFYSFQDNGKAFEIENKDNPRCTVMEQKETPDGLKDEPCDREVQGNQAGLCEWVMVALNQFILNFRYENTCCFPICEVAI